MFFTKEMLTADSRTHFINKTGENIKFYWVFTSFITPSERITTSHRKNEKRFNNRKN